jgi:hypothetical protein
MYQSAAAPEQEIMPPQAHPAGDLDPSSNSTVESADQSDDLTLAFLRLTNLPTCPLDRLSRYEARLWRQACQILLTLQCLDRRKPWERPPLRANRDRVL